MICELYLAGSTGPELANRFHLSKAWIGQILARNGIEKADRPRSRGRAGTVTVRLPSAVKAALEAESGRDGASLSAWVAGLITRDLRERGVSIVESMPNEVDVPLPLED